MSTSVGSSRDSLNLSLEDLCILLCRNIVRETDESMRMLRGIAADLCEWYDIPYTDVREAMSSVGGFELPFEYECTGCGGMLDEVSEDEYVEGQEYFCGPGCEAEFRK